MTAIPGPSEPESHNSGQSRESSALTGYPVTPPPLPGPVTFDQHWGELTFVHWPVLPESVAHLYPPGRVPTSSPMG